MKRGLVIGKFLPVHLGHIALIEFAASNCDELIVSMSYTDEDPIAHELRLTWLKDIFVDRKTIAVHSICDDFDDDSLPLEERTRIWADVIKRTYPHIDILFSSEDYGVPFARNLEVEHVTFDQKRTRYPVSASLVRKHPFNYWDFIPNVVRPFFVKKVCFFGPESTGKTMLAEKIAHEFNTVWVPEVAREMLTSNSFSVEEIKKIGVAHYARLKGKLPFANKILICDTDVITTQIYSRHYLQVIPDILYQLESEVKLDYYFLFDVDVPWVPDGLRDLGHMRNEMFEIFERELVKRRLPYMIIRGTYDVRHNTVRRKLQEILNGK